MKRSLPVIALTLLAACTSLRWSGSPPPGSRESDALHPPPSAPGPEIEPIAIATSTRARHVAAPLPEPAPGKLRTAVYYSDLGPDELDTSSLPLQQRANYRVYAQACSRCHDLSRSLYAPHTAGAWLEFYLTNMRVRARYHERPFTKLELQAVRDFLNYDAQERKGANAREFEAQTEQLKRRFDALMDERLERIQKSTPALSP